MSGPIEKMEQPGKPALFKSKKEFVMLGGAALVFVVVICKMYIFKSPKVTGVAELNPAVAESSDSPAPVPARLPDVAAMLALEDREQLVESQTPTDLARDPFAMSEAMRAQVYKSKVEARTTEEPAAVVTLTVENQRDVLSKIAGAEEAGKTGLRLEAVMTSGDWKGAVINGRVVSLGKTVLGLTLADVFEDGVLLELGKQQFKLFIPRPSG